MTVDWRDLTKVAEDHGHTMMVGAPAYRRIMGAIQRARDTTRDAVLRGELEAAMIDMRRAVVMRRKVAKPVTI